MRCYDVSAVFFRNQTWREHIEHTLAWELPNIIKLMASFTAHFQKQRYEMVAIALEQLLPLRELCETELAHVDDIFKDFQDRELLVDVRAASAWAELWIFLEASNRLLARPIEKSKRGGMVCPGCSEQRHDTQRQSKCPRASRRLGELRAFVAALREKLRVAPALTICAWQNSGMLFELCKKSRFQCVQGVLKWIRSGYDPQNHRG